MAWYLNHYECERCAHRWSDEWSSMSNDECPSCGLGDMMPYGSDDLTEIILPRDGTFVILRSPDTAEHHPEYGEVAVFPSKQQAKIHLRQKQPE